MEIKVVQAEESTKGRVSAEWGSLTWLAGAEHGGAEGTTVGRVVIKKNESNPRHSHPTCEEVLYLLGGKLEHSVGDETTIMEPGDTIILPAGVYHNAKSVGDVDADMIVSYNSARRDFQPED